jgi:hypothetical protein
MGGQVLGCPGGVGARAVGTLRSGEQGAGLPGSIQVGRDAGGQGPPATLLWGT